MTKKQLTNKILTSDRALVNEAEWDHKLRELMKKHKFVPIKSLSGAVYNAKLGDVVVWVENYPYASFNPYEPNIRVRPSRTTLVLAREKYLRDVLDF